MKNLFFYLALFISAFAFVGCADDDQDVPTNLDYPFKATETYNNTAFTNNPVTIQINVTNEFQHQAPGDLTFSFTYTSTKNGKITLDNVDYNQGDEVPLHLGINTITYTPFESGNHTLSMSYKNNKNNSYSSVINLTITEPLFDFTINGTSVNPFVGNTYPVGLFIDNMNSPDNTTYQYSFTFLEGTAEISRNDDLLDQNNWYSINHSVNHQIAIKTTEIGNLKILFKAKSNNNSVIERTIQWNVAGGNFTFNLNNTSYPAVYLNQDYPINLFVQRGVNQPQDVTFQFKYIIEEGSANITKDGSLIEQNSYYDLEEGNQIPITIKPTAGNNLKVKFTAKDSYGSTIDRTLLWAIESADFIFNATTNTQQIFPTQNFNINVQVDGTNTDGSMTFLLKWGEINEQGNFIGAVQTLPVNQAFYQNNVQFQFPEDGNYQNRKIRVEATNNHNIQKHQDFIINVKDPKPILNSWNLQWDYDDGGHPTYNFEISGINVTKSPLAPTNNFVSVEVKVDDVYYNTFNFTDNYKIVELNINNSESTISLRVIDSDGRKTDWMDRSIPWP